MQYIKHKWADGEVIDAKKMNNIETGIVETKRENENNNVELMRLKENINKMLGADATTMEQLQTMIAYVDENKDILDEIITGKVNVTDIVDDLFTNVSNKPLSAAQGVVLRGLIVTLQENLTSHNIDTAAHSDLRAELKALTDRITAILDSDDETLDELSEIVAYIKSNKTLIDAITTSKVSVSDIVNDLVTNVTNKPLSAAQGVALKGLIDTLQTAMDGKAPTSHAASSTTYGAGSGNTYGHVKLSDAVNETSNANGGVAATPAAVKTAYDLASSHNQSASTITAGTFGGQVVANNSAQTPGISLLRNTQILKTETTPSVNGEIWWNYE